MSSLHGNFGGRLSKKGAHASVGILQGGATLDAQIEEAAVIAHPIPSSALKTQSIFLD